MARYQRALRSVSYVNLSRNPSAALRTVTVKVSDGKAIGTGTRTITVTPVNNAPSIAVRLDARMLRADSLLAFVGAFMLRDVDAQSGQLRLTLRVSRGTLNLSTLTGLTFDAGSGNGTSEIRVLGNLADLNAAMNGLRYAANFRMPGNDALRIAIDDLGNTGTGTPKTAVRTVFLINMTRASYRPLSNLPV